MSAVADLPHFGGLEANSRVASPRTAKAGPSRLAQRNDEIGSFAGFPTRDALIGNDDRAAGRKRFDDTGLRSRRYGEAIQGFGGAVRLRRQRLHLGGGRHLSPARRALVLVAPFGVAGRHRQ